MVEKYLFNPNSLLSLLLCLASGTTALATMPALWLHLSFDCANFQTVRKYSSTCSLVVLLEQLLLTWRCHSLVKDNGLLLLVHHVHSHDGP